MARPRLRDLRHLLSEPANEAPRAVVRRRGAWMLDCGHGDCAQDDELAYAWPALDEHRYALFFTAAEGFAVLVEAALLRAFKVERALLWALVANASSVAFGLVTRFLFDWP